MLSETEATDRRAVQNEIDTNGPAGDELLTVVSADCHAGLPTDRYSEYLPARFHEELHDYCAHRYQARAAGVTLGSKRNGFSIWKQKFLDDFTAEDLVDDTGPTGGWDFEVRLKDLDSDGVAGEVIFPGPVNVFVETSIPFQGPGFFGDTFTAESSFGSMWAGARAYNRWLAEQLDPKFQAGLALVPTMSDLDEVLKEVEWATSVGFKGMYVRQGEVGLPPLGDQRYERFWASCQDHDLVVNLHGGVGTPTGEKLMNPVNGSIGTSGIETALFGIRPLWYIIPAGVFDRYPNLRMSFTEVHASWAPTIIDMLDTRWEDPWLQDHGKLERKPSEVWAHNFGIGASFLSRAEVLMRKEIGIDVIMYGSDYPHVEGIWPNTKMYMREIFAGVSEPEVRKLAGENAIRFYRLDPGSVRARAAQCQVRVSDVTSGEPDPAGFHSKHRHIARAHRPSSWVFAGVPRGFSRGE
jgi:predicted TIM-barrel fold metal-dependent hydrolase